MWVKPLWIAGIAVALVLLLVGNGLAETRVDANGSNDEENEGGCIHIHNEWPFIIVHPSYCKDRIKDLITPEDRF